MSPAFTRTQEARLREIVREEIGRGGLKPGEFHRIAERFLEMMPVRASDVTGVRALMRRLKERLDGSVLFYPLGGGPPRRFTSNRRSPPEGSR